MQYAVEGRNYVLFEFAANSGNFIRRAIAVVTVANGALVYHETQHSSRTPSCSKAASLYHCFSAAIGSKIQWNDEESICFELMTHSNSAEECWSNLRGW